MIGVIAVVDATIVVVAGDADKYDGGSRRKDVEFGLWFLMILVVMTLIVVILMVEDCNVRHIRRLIC